MEKMKSSHKWSAQMVELSFLLQELDVPAIRKDLTKISNIRWLNRNIAINNQGPVLEKARTLIKNILKGIV